MTIRSLELLILGRREVARHYREARKRWLNIYSEEKHSSVADLARRLDTEQLWFEENCGGHHFGQEVMVWAALATFYSTKSGWKAGGAKFIAKLVDAFDASYCSIEVKYEMKDAATAYHVDEIIRS